LALALGGAAGAEPALWVVRDADSTLHLFGTVHVMKPDVAWKTPRIAEAFAVAQEVWLEVDVLKANDPAAMGPLMPLMMETGTPISKALSPEEYARFKAFTASLGIPAEQMDALKPMMVAATLAVVAMMKQGYDPNAGVDKVLAEKTPDGALRTLETLEQQMRFLTGLPQEVQLDLLRDTMDQLGRQGYLDTMMKAWQDGDMETLETLYLPDLKKHPQAYEAFLKTRNHAWADALAKELEGAGTDFVAVGALHLVGPDSVQQLLKARGYTVERVN